MADPRSKNQYKMLIQTDFINQAVSGFKRKKEKKKKKGWGGGGGGVQAEGERTSRRENN